MVGAAWALGQLPLATVFAPAIELAEEGFVASVMLTLASHLIHDVAGAQELCPHGPLGLEEHVRLPSVGRTLRAIVREGRKGFYQGEFGHALIDVGHGIFTSDDLARSLAQWDEPLRLRVWAHDLWTVPAPSQGYLTLASAWIAEQRGIGADPSDPLWAHLVIEASRAAGHDRPTVLYDRADGRTLLAEHRLSRAAARIDPDRAAPTDVALGTVSSEAGRVGRAGAIPRMGDGDTTHLCAIDADGLGISLTQSNALDFGSHVVAGSTGIFLHNRGLGFSLEAGHPAELAPGRRPPHTLSPMLATTPDGTLSHLVGAMGGDAQPQIILQVLARMLPGGQDPATALAERGLSLDAPGAGPFRVWWGDDLQVAVEAHAPTAWIDDLRRRGHRVRPISASTRRPSAARRSFRWWPITSSARPIPKPLWRDGQPLTSQSGCDSIGRVATGGDARDGGGGGRRRRRRRGLPFFRHEAGGRALEAGAAVVETGVTRALRRGRSRPAR